MPELNKYSVTEHGVLKMSTSQVALYFFQVFYFFIFCLDGLAIIENGVLKTVITVALCISSFSSGSFASYILGGSLLLVFYIYICLQLFYLPGLTLL